MGAMTPPPPSTTSAVARFMLGSLAAIAVVVIGGFFALRSITIDEAERDIRDRARVEGRLVQSAGLSNGVLRRDPEELAFLDEIVRAQVLTDPIVRVKIWSRDGEILYSDEPRLIGERFELGEEERELFATGGADAELSDLSEEENRYERKEGKLLEAHSAIRTPDGTPVLFEVYARFESVTANGERLLQALAPPLIGGLLVLLLVQVPLAYSLARRLQRAHTEREGLLATAVASSEQERRRIAADLHDGVVQDLAGVAFGLAPLADRAQPDDAPALRDATARLRQGVRDLRTLLVEIYPPRIAAAGLEGALNDLLSPLAAAGLQTRLHVDDGSAAGSRNDALIYRVAREAVRNVREHAQAGLVEVDITTSDGRVRLAISDDGRGFDDAERVRRGREGHLGLSLLGELVQQAGGTLHVRSTPGAGTTVDLEVPA
jgi:two-component system NarL family sensor kinase